MQVIIQDEDRLKLKAEMKSKQLIRVILFAAIS